MKRAEQKEKRRQKILSVGLDLFIKKGYGATKTAEIAQAVGMSEGLLFHYFETKEKLYLELIAIAASGKDNVFEAQITDAIGFFEKTAETIIGYISKEPFAAKLFVLMSQARYNEALPPEAQKKLMRKSDIEKSVSLIIQGQHDRTIRKGEPVALAIAFWMAIQGIAESIARNPELPVPEPSWIVDILRSK